MLIREVYEWRVAPPRGVDGSQSVTVDCVGLFLPRLAVLTSACTEYERSTISGIVRLGRYNELCVKRCFTSIASSIIHCPMQTCQPSHRLYARSITSYRALL